MRAFRRNFGIFVLGHLHAVIWTVEALPTWAAIMISVLVSVYVGFWFVMAMIDWAEWR